MLPYWALTPRKGHAAPLQKAHTKIFCTKCSQAVHKKSRRRPGGILPVNPSSSRSALQLVKLDRLLIAIGRSLIIAEAQLIACSIEAQDGSIARDDHTIGLAERDGVDRVGSSIRELQRILTVGSVNILAVDLERVAVRGLLDRDSDGVQLGAGSDLAVGNRGGNVAVDSVIAVEDIGAGLVGLVDDEVI